MSCRSGRRNYAAKCASLDRQTKRTEHSRSAPRCCYISPLFERLGESAIYCFHLQPAALNICQICFACQDTSIISLPISKGLSMASEEARATPVDPEKTVVGVSVQVRESNSTEHVNEKRDIENCEHVQWEPGFWKRFPWLGCAAIVTMLLCIAMDGVILGTSRWKYREEWPAHQKWEFISKEWRKKSQIEPHVLLAIVNTVTNVALGVAIGHGVAIAWWRRVLKGSTIEVGRSREGLLILLTIQ